MHGVCGEARRASMALTTSACRPPDGPLPLTTCTNVAISGTGSRALFSLLAQHSSLAHHDEDQLTVAPGATCVIATIADPARRMEAALRFQQRYRSSRLRRREPLALSLPTANGSLNGSRVATARAIIEEIGVQTSRLARLYRASVNGLPSWRDDGKGARKDRGSSGERSKAVTRGSLFLVSQTRWLRSLNATCAASTLTRAPRLRLVCTERLHDEWANILAEARWPFPWESWMRDKWECSWQLLLDAPSRLLGRTPSLAPCNTIRWRLPHAAESDEFGLNERNARAEDTSSSVLSTEDAKYVREVLYPADWALHQQVCANERRSTRDDMPSPRRASWWAHGTLLAVGVPILHLGLVAAVFAVPCVFLLRCAALAARVLCFEG